MNQQTLICYHTQEKRDGTCLTQPIICTRKDAWLGEGYYFWKEIADAHKWGVQSKNNDYIIYSSKIDTSKFLDLAFNEEHYNFFIEQINKVSKVLQKKTKRLPKLHEIYRYIKDKNIWINVSGIVFSDYPNKKDIYQPIITFNGKIINIPFFRRIQYVVYNTSVISDFKKSDD